jgi:LPXTG-motif cell wall-anchored protein
VAPATAASYRGAGDLPFTGFPALGLILAGAILALAGLFLRFRRLRAVRGEAALLARRLLRSAR